MDASVPLHQPGDMLFNAPMTREETWQTIPKRTRKELKRRSGKPIDWIANLGPDGLPWAVTFGKRGLAAYRTNFDVFSFDFTPAPSTGCRSTAATLRHRTTRGQHAGRPA